METLQTRKEEAALRALAAVEGPGSQGARSQRWVGEGEGTAIASSCKGTDRTESWEDPGGRGQRWDTVHSAPCHLVNLNGNLPLHWEAVSDSPSRRAAACGGVLRDSKGLPFSNPAAREFWGGTSHPPFPVCGSD